MLTVDVEGYAFNLNIYLEVDIHLYCVGGGNRVGGTVAVGLLGIPEFHGAPYMEVVDDKLQVHRLDTDGFENLARSHMIVEVDFLEAQVARVGMPEG